MNAAIRNMLGLQQPKVDEKPSRTSYDLAAELETTEESIKHIAERVAEADSEVSDSRRIYDLAIQAYAVGNAANEPSRAALEAAVTRRDSLARVEKDIRRRAAELRSELTASALNEATAAGRAAIPELTARAEALATTFASAVAEARQTEAELMRVLFDEKSGLKQPFPEELNREARGVRFSIRRRIEAAARKARFSLHPEIETDGNCNMASDEHWYRAKIDPPIRIDPNPRDCGELIPEDLDHAVRKTEPVVTW